MKLIVGLGNPGEKYKNVRHNLGFRVVDEMAKEMENGKWKMENRFKAEILNSQFSILNLILAKPTTFMNNSGLAVKLLTTYYQLPATDLIVVYDELDLALGKIKVRLGGAAAGHHGVESIINSLVTDQFTRVRLGIGPSVGPAEKFVLDPFKSTEKPQVRHMIKQALAEILRIVST